jgi:glycosyltransferase involved in cell wall biosynthesis
MNEKKPPHGVVSIITVTRNRRDFLARAVASVLAQDYPAIEHIVVDANSSDGTREFLKRCEELYRNKNFGFRWISEPDSGMAEGINKGFRLATGEYVCLLHDDDTLEPGAVAKFIEAFREHPEIDLVYGENFDLLPDGERRLSTYRLYSLRDMARNGYQIPQCSFLAKRELLEKYGDWDESLRHVAEHDAFMRFAEHGAHFLYIPVPFQSVEIHAERVSSAFFKRGLEETKMVNFRHGGSYVSRFYFLYLRDKYFKGFVDVLREKMPRLFTAVKKIFNKMTTDQ